MSCHSCNYKIKFRTTPGALNYNTSLTIWKDGCAITGITVKETITNKEAKEMGERMVEEYSSQFEPVGEYEVSGRIGMGLLV